MSNTELQQLTSEFREGLLGGRSSSRMCDIVCYPLAGYLSFLGVPNSLETSYVQTPEGEVEHYWLKLADGSMLDPTADQWNQYGHDFPPVYIGEKPGFYLDNWTNP